MRPNVKNGIKKALKKLESFGKMMIYLKIIAIRFRVQFNPKKKFLSS